MPPPPQCAVECMWKGLPLFLAKCRAARFIISSRVKRACITQASQGQRDFLLAINVSFAGAVSTSSCMLRMETNGETDHLQHDLFVDISYKFTLAQGFVSYACTRITMNTCLSGKKLVLSTWIQCFMVNAHTFNNHKS